jgi:hypothetical protein
MHNGSTLLQTKKKPKETMNMKQKNHAFDPKMDGLLNQFFKHREARAVSPSSLLRILLIVCFAMLNVDSQGTLLAGVAR